MEAVVKAAPTTSDVPTTTTKWGSKVSIATTTNRRYSEANSPYRSLHQLARRSIWTEAVRIQAVVIRSAAGSIACAWLSNACFCLGNVFSGKTSSLQTHRELVVSNMMWFSLWYCTLVLIAHVPRLRSLHFIGQPDTYPSVMFCIKRLFRGSYPFALVTVSLTFGASLLITNTSLREYKMDVYLSILSSAVFNTAIEITFRRVYFLETMEGRGRLLKRKSRQISPSHKVIPPCRPPRRWPVYRKALSEVLGLSLIAGYVHIVSLQRLQNLSGTFVGLFTLGSFVFKLMVQELAKHYVLKTRIRDIRIMCVIAALPTVLIDTQTRILLLGLQNTKSVAVGTIAMAFVELISRFVKAAWLAWGIDRHKKRMQLNLQATDADLSVWLEKRYAYHAAETHADMFAEYIALGCSASVLCLLGRNVHYSRLGLQGKASKATQLGSIAGQIVVEMVVDYVAIALEMATGVEYTKIKHLSSFLAVVFMTIAFLNIMIIVMIYMDDHIRV